MARYVTYHYGPPRDRLVVARGRADWRLTCLCWLERAHVGRVANGHEDTIFPTGPVLHRPAVRSSR